MGPKVTDPRFSHVHADPKFKSVKNKKSKVKVDKRFSAALKDRDFTSIAAVDEFGRHSTEGKVDDLTKYYEFSDSDDNTAPDPTKFGFSDSEESDMENFDAVSVLAQSRREMEGLDTPENEEMIEEEDVPTISVGEESTRLAICHLDWDKVSALDLFALASSFAPQSKKIVSCVVYISDFGIDRLKHEELNGPELEDIETIKQEMPNEVNTNEEALNESIRRYEILKRRYYFGVLECDDVDTAVTVYKELDGTGIGQTGNTIDLRFVPTEVDFSGRPVRDSADSIPTKYSPPDVVATTLDHTNVTVSWDRDDAPQRMILHKKVNKKEVDEADYEALVADTSEEEPEFDSSNLSFDIQFDIVPTTDVGENVSLLINSDRKEEGKELRRRALREVLLTGFKEEEEEGQDDDGMVVEDVTDSEDQDNVDSQDESESMEKEVILSLPREKSKKRSDDLLFSDDDVPSDLEMHHSDEESADEQNNTTMKTKTRKRGHDSEEDQVDERKRAELALLSLSDNPLENKGVSNSSEQTQKKLSRRAKAKAKIKQHHASKVSSVDTSDSRFAAVYDNPDFSIDPTAPSFKRTEGMKELLKEKVKRRTKKESSQDEVSVDSIADKFRKRLASSDGQPSKKR
ncbi:hypothetical protein RCL1_006138 [Eukaryota sp. TZLM3-RCL]